MSAKTSAARRAAFMAAVAETGNQTLACERAKVSRSWVTLRRATDPAFRAELDAAVETARARLEDARAAGGSMVPGRGWGSVGGEELVARGGNGRRTQIARARIKQWTPRVEQRFLEVLAGCCNVKAACAAVGLTQASAYNHRHRWSSFRDRWDKALETGFVRIETAMVGQMGVMLGAETDEEGDGYGYGYGSGTAPDLTITHMTVDAALQAMWQHQRRVTGTGKAPGARRVRVRTLEEVQQAILSTITAVTAREAMGPEAAAVAKRAVAKGAAAVARSRGPKRR